MVCPLPGGSWTAFDRTPVLEISGLDGEPMHFWAKTTPDGQPGISVRDHCLNVGCVAEALIESLPESLRQLLPPGSVALAALHDVGKMSAGFQQKCPAWLQ